jgi:hypothetical protein
LSAIRDCLFNIFEATLRIWTRGRAIPCGKGPTRREVSLLKVRYPFPI